MAGINVTQLSTLPRIKGFEGILGIYDLKSFTFLSMKNVLVKQNGPIQNNLWWISFPASLYFAPKNYRNIFIYFFFFTFNNSRV